MYNQLAAINCPELVRCRQREEAEEKHTEEGDSHELCILTHTHTHTHTLTHTHTHTQTDSSSAHQQTKTSKPVNTHCSHTQKINFTLEPDHHIGRYDAFTDLSGFIIHLFMLADMHQYKTF